MVIAMVLLLYEEFSKSFLGSVMVSVPFLPFKDWIADSLSPSGIGKFIPQYMYRFQD